ncbi:unnamed protein product [Soboliphyme baturini]|uniref:m7GpppX diphosphatase n=1 Tax=Soboliphyme baturini TaxID=241478 RepID=A0A183IUH7_9BILA|nr:unnamed protein product [Soboliphyme baturini]
MTDDQRTTTMKAVNDFGFLKLQEVLMDAPEKKLMCIHAKSTAEGDENQGADAVVIFEKHPFTVASIEKILSGDVRMTLLMENDVYRTYDLLAPQELNVIKSTLIYPATERHIEKWRVHDMEMVEESAATYKAVTLPFLQSNQFSIQWVYNILEGRAENDRIIMDETDPKDGFVLAPDLKWDGKTLENLYVTAIVRQRGIRSEAIEKRYDVRRSSLRIFLHYQPTYYHLHVHFTHLKSETMSQSAGKAILLDDVIDNVQLLSDYYATKTMHFVLKTNDPLYLEFVAKGVIKSA